MPSRRIAFVHFYTFRMLRGIEILVLSLADELVKQDYDVSILTARRMMEPRVIPDPRLRIPEVTLPRCYEEWSIAAQYAWGLVRNKTTRSLSSSLTSARRTRGVWPTSAARLVEYLQNPPGPNTL
ncbi:MAG TPA: hypothetical protein VMT34_05560 [Aggregatilineales bacterium]|nr:hypothetical protein [Aggregatilineales bacterium]